MLRFNQATTELMLLLCTHEHAEEQDQAVIP